MENVASVVVPTWTVNRSNAVVVVVSLLTIFRKKLSVEAVQPAGMLTDWLSVSVWVAPSPSSHASRVPVRGAPVPVFAPITPAVAVHGAEPVSKPGLPSFWPGLAHAPPAPAIVIVNDVEPDPAVLVAVTVTVNVPAAVRVPDTVPVPEPIVSPGGSPLADQVLSQPATRSA